MKTLNTLTLLIGLACAGSAFALPVLNKNTPGAETVTIFPDHADPNLYYTAPTVFTISKNEAGVPNFSYIEYLTNGYRRAFIQATLRPDFTYSEMEKAKQNILAINPAAHFTALPFEKASVSFTDSLKVLMVESDCQHPAGTVGDEQTCAFHLRNQGVKVLRPMLKKGLAITTQFIYTINGVRQNADGTYSDSLNTYQVAGRIGGPDLAAHPELFQDYKGNVINGLMPSLATFLEMNAEAPVAPPVKPEQDLGLSPADQWQAAPILSSPVGYKLDMSDWGQPMLTLHRRGNEGVLRFIMKPEFRNYGPRVKPKKIEAQLQPSGLVSASACRVLPEEKIECEAKLTEMGLKFVTTSLNSGLPSVAVNVIYTYEVEGHGETLVASSSALQSEYFTGTPLKP